MPKLVLAIDTSADYCSIAIGGSGACLHSFSRFAPREHSEILHPAIARALAEIGCLPAEAARMLGGIAVTTGPGSFTGLRIGIAAAKGLAHAWGLPVIGIPTLEVMANAARQGEQGLVAAALGTRSGDCYAGLFAAAQIGETLAALPTAALKHVRSLAAQAAGAEGQGGPRVLFCGAPWRAVAELLSEETGAEALAAPSYDWPDPAVLAAMGAVELAQGRGRAPADLAPQYIIRPADRGLPAGEAC